MPHKNRCWKIPHIAKGMLTHVPPLNWLRRKRHKAGWTSYPEYCYRVWHHRHLRALKSHGFNVTGSAIAELGPGDTIGTGLAALLSGAGYYTGIDVVPTPACANLEPMLDALITLHRKEGLPVFNPGRIKYDLAQGIGTSRIIRYMTSWEDTGAIAPSSLDLVFSQSALQYVDLEKVYRAMFRWLRPGGYASHRIDFRSHGLSPYWNGHWAYSEVEWSLACGRREFFLNRAPLSSHLNCARQAGFEVLLCERDPAAPGLAAAQLAAPFKSLAPEDLATCGAFLILRRP